MRRPVYLALAIGMLLSLAGFYVAFRHVAIHQLLQNLQDIRYPWLVLAAGVGFSSYAVRTWRWQLMLIPHKLSFSAAYHPLIIAFMLNMVLPGRIGELARPALLKRQSHIPYSLGLTTVVSERLLDLMTLLVLLAWALTAAPAQPQLQTTFAGYQLDHRQLDAITRHLGHICIGGALLLIAVSMPPTQRLIKAVLGHLPPLCRKLHPKLEGFSHKHCQALSDSIDHMALGLTLLKKPGRLLACLGYSLLIWLLQAWAMYLTARALPQLEIGFLPITITFIIICFFITLPSVPGYWGIWEAAAVFALALFGIKAPTAAGYALVSHILLIFPVLLAGLLAIIVTGTKLSALQQPPSTDNA